MFVVASCEQDNKSNNKISNSQSGVDNENQSQSQKYEDREDTINNEKKDEESEQVLVSENSKEIDESEESLSIENKAQTDNSSNETDASKAESKITQDEISDKEVKDNEIEENISDEAKKNIELNEVELIYSNDKFIESEEEKGLITNHIDVQVKSTKGNIEIVDIVSGATILNVPEGLKSKKTIIDSHTVRFELEGLAKDHLNKNDSIAEIKFYEKAFNNLDKNTKLPELVYEIKIDFNDNEKDNQLKKDEKEESKEEENQEKVDGITSSSKKNDDNESEEETDEGTTNSGGTSNSGSENANNNIVEVEEKKDDITKKFKVSVGNNNGNTGVNTFIKRDEIFLEERETGVFLVFTLENKYENDFGDFEFYKGDTKLSYEKIIEKPSLRVDLGEKKIAKSIDESKSLASLIIPEGLINDLSVSEGEVLNLDDIKIKKSGKEEKLSLTIEREINVVTVECSSQVFNEGTENDGSINNYIDVKVNSTKGNVEIADIVTGASIVKPPKGMRSKKTIIDKYTARFELEGTANNHKENDDMDAVIKFYKRAFKNIDDDTEFERKAALEIGEEEGAIEVNIEFNFIDKEIEEGSQEALFIDESKTYIIEIESVIYAIVALKQGSLQDYTFFIDGANVQMDKVNSEGTILKYELKGRMEKVFNVVKGSEKDEITLDFRGSKSIDKAVNIVYSTDILVEDKSNDGSITGVVDVQIVSNDENVEFVDGLSSATFTPMPEGTKLVGERVNGNKKMWRFLVEGNAEKHSEVDDKTIKIEFRKDSFKNITNEHKLNGLINEMTLDFKNVMEGKEEGAFQLVDGRNVKVLEVEYVRYLIVPLKKGSKDDYKFYLDGNIINPKAVNAEETILKFEIIDLLNHSFKVEGNGIEEIIEINRGKRYEKES